MIIIARGRAPVQDERFSFFVRKDKSPETGVLLAEVQNVCKFPLAMAKVKSGKEYDGWIHYTGQIIAITEAADFSPVLGLSLE